MAMHDAMDRKFLLLCAAAIPLGLAGGYAWSAYTAPPPKAYVPPKATIAPIADSPDEYPAALDDEWAQRGSTEPAPVAKRNRNVEQSVHYSGCNEVRAAGKAPLYDGDPGYREEMDGDGDGIACEPIRH